MNDILKTFNVVSVFKALLMVLLLKSKLALVSVQFYNHIVHRVALPAHLNMQSRN